MTSAFLKFFFLDERGHTKLNMENIYGKKIMENISVKQIYFFKYFVSIDII